MTASDPLRKATRACGANRSTFGSWTHPKPPGNREIRRVLISDAIGQVHGDSRGTYGYRRVQAALRIERELVVNHKIGASVMANLRLSGPPRRKSRKRNLITVRTSSVLVNRNFTTTGPNQLWVTDITGDPAREDTVYACAVPDVFSCRAAGWAIDRRAETSLVNHAFVMAHSTRRPAAG